MKRILFSVLMSLCVAAGAQVFQRTGPDGEVSFSDEPSEGATPVEVVPAQTISLPAVAETDDSAQQADAAATAYTEFAIVSPAAEQEVRANDGNVALQLSLEPALMPGHSVLLTVDGEDDSALMSADALTVELSNLSRGRHKVAAKVIDDAGQTLIQAEPVSFQVLRAAVGGR
jgi:hypothetical protein